MPRSEFEEREWEFRGLLPQIPEGFFESVMVPAAPEEDYDVLCSMKQGSVTGPDGFPAGLYIKFWRQLCRCFLHLLTMFLEAGDTPQLFSEGRLILIPKGDRVVRVRRLGVQSSF